jgi:hypothetical protein
MPVDLAQEGYRCDCPGCGDWDYPIEFDTSLDASTVTPLLYRCCTYILHTPLVREQMDGHFCTEYGNLKKAVMKDLWRASVIDGTWMCWHCLATRIGSDYDTVACSQLNHHWDSLYEQKGKDNKRRKSFVRLLESDERRNALPVWRQEAADRLLAALCRASL